MESQKKEKKEPIESITKQIEKKKIDRKLLPADFNDLSKNQQKKAIKRVEWDQKKDLIKQANKEKKKQSKLNNPKKENPTTQYAHLNRFNFYDVEKGEEVDPKDCTVIPPKISKHDKLQLFQELCKKGPKIIIDCEFDELMLDKEKKSVAQQLSFCYNANKKAKIPTNLIVSGITNTDHVSYCMNKACSRNWCIDFINTDNSAGKHDVQQDDAKEKIVARLDAKNNYMSFLKTQNIQSDKIVYLTADSPNTIEELDESKVYIIGGIVDRNRYKNLTLDKAIAQGISHAKLPILEHVKLNTSTVLTINQIFEMMVEQYHLKNWKETFEKVIPERKFQGFDEKKKQLEEESK